MRYLIDSSCCVFTQETEYDLVIISLRDSYVMGATEANAGFSNASFGDSGGVPRLLEAEKYKDWSCPTETYKSVC